MLPSPPPKETPADGVANGNAPDAKADNSPPKICPGCTLTDSTGRKGSYRDWNRLADAMETFHNRFRWEYETAYKNADGGFKSLDRFLHEAQQLSLHLDLHHRLEEAYIFPLLAKKNPRFGKDHEKNGQHIEHHRKIHAGLERYDKFLADAKANPKEYDGKRLRAVMDSFHDVLFDHLAAEVADLSAQSTYEHGFTLDELRRFPM